MFSPEYQDVIARTPHIRYKTSLVVKLLLVVLLLVLSCWLRAPSSASYRH